MKYLNALIASVIAVLSFAASPVIADDAFSDLFSQTKICFSHIAIAGGWETEVAVLNPTTKTVTGNFTFYDMDGNQLGAAVPVTLNAHGRYQVDVGATFGQRGNVEYVIFTAMASAPQNSGLFTKIDHGGWTGIAFVNVSSTVANVILTAYSDTGESIAIESMEMEPGEKTVDTAKNIFYPQSISGASYVSFTSNQGVVSFFLNGSGGKLDGSKAL